MCEEKTSYHQPALLYKSVRVYKSQSVRQEKGS